MKATAAAAGLAGLGLAAWLLHSYGFERVLALLGRAGWTGVGAVTGFHLLQVLFSAWAWRMIAGPAGQGPGLGLGGYLLARWIREGVNNLLPVAQIGGEFVSARLLRGRGAELTAAIAGTVADVTIELVTQIAFTLAGLGLLLQSGAGGGIAETVGWGLLIGCLAAGGFLGAQWFGLASGIERALLWLGRKLGWAGAGRAAGLHEALIGCYRAPGRVLLAAAGHMTSWILGAAEIWLALYFLGHEVGFAAALVIESLGQALKTAGFAVPGALGVQEGGYIVICQLFGLAPEVAIALSLMKRLREAGLGVPALIAWQWLEARAPRKAPAESGA